MYLKEMLEKYNNKHIDIYVDMDGVIADYEVGVAYDFDKKRPLLTSIKKLEEISMMPNVNLHILSVSGSNEGIWQKKTWLKKYAPFFEDKNIHILSKETIINTSSSQLKLDYLKSINMIDKIVILIDDDPLVLKNIKANIDNIVLLKDTALID